MPSENKTPNYGLNQWQGNEYPKRQDFVDDNIIIDAEIKKAQDKANQAFQSASDGKQKIATAITGKGVPTGSSDTFQKMADNIKAIETDPSIGTTDAVAADILAPKKVVSQGQLIIGTMPNWGPTVAETVNLTDNNQHYSIAAGYHSGLRIIKAVITGLTANVIKAGTTVGGIVGTFTSDANAVDADVLSGKTYYRNGIKGTGSMTDRGAINQTLSSQGQQYTIPAGKHSGSGKVTANFANLTAGNVKEGVNVGGVVGTYNNEGYNLEAANISGSSWSIDKPTLPFYVRSATITENANITLSDLLLYIPYTYGMKFKIEAIDNPIIVYDGFDSSLNKIFQGSSMNFENAFDKLIYNLKGGRFKLTEITGLSSRNITYYVCISKPN